MNWEQAFYITATLLMWGSVILWLILFGEIMRFLKQLRRGIRKVDRMGDLLRYGILKRLLSLMRKGGE